MDLKENEQCIYADMDKLKYSGRIDFSDPLAPIFVFPGSSVSMSFTGTKLKVLVRNNHAYYDNYIGYILDGVQKKVLLKNDDSIQEILLGDALLEDKTHELILFKRQDGCHEFTFHGFILSIDAKVVTPLRRPKRRMEFYGDSASAGKLIEAKKLVDRAGNSHNGEYSNAWDSYAMVTARNLHADVSIIAQEGIALLDNAGNFHAPNSIGMESIYDKLHFNPAIGDITTWDFNRYNPQVVIIDIGQYDAVPKDYMKEDKDGAAAKNWRQHYKKFVLNIREKYPKSYIVLTTTIVNHHSSWDRAIGSICQEINDDKIMHFIYSNNGYGTPFYTNLQEAEQMAFELSMFLKSMEPDIWICDK